MRRILLFILMVGAFQAKSQQNRFAFFQAAPNEPFYIRMDETILSSTAFGYLVVPKLNDGKYTFFIGLPNNKSSEQQFEFVIAGADRGFELKKGVDGGLRLYDWQKMVFVDPATKQQEAAKPATEAKTDNYSKLMAGVVNDPAVAMVDAQAPVQQTNSVASSLPPAVSGTDSASLVAVTAVDAATSSSNVPPHTDTIRPVKELAPRDGKPDISGHQEAVAKQTVETVSPEIDTIPKKSEPGHQESVPAVGPTSAAQPFHITSLSDIEKGGYREMVYVDYNNLATDTIEVRIPLEPQTASSDAQALYRVKEVKKDDSLAATASAVQLVNSDCKRFATDSDVDKLRIAILNANGNEAKVGEAKKVFKSRCFTTRQIRGLSELFSSDDGRLKFFEASYPYVSDSANFRSLVSLLEDSFYINRFKALVRMTD